MSPTGAEHETALFREAGEAPAAIARHLTETAAFIGRLVRAIRAFDPVFVVTCARGSSDHAATYAKYLIETTLGLATASYAPSIASIYGRALKLERALFIAISQSGGSADLVASAQAARAQGALTIAFVNETESPLAQACAWVVPLHAGREHSVAASKSYIASLAAIAHLVAHWAEDAGLQAGLAKLPEQLAAAWTLDWSPALAVLGGAGNSFMVSRGLGLGLAQEAALKCKETAQQHAEAFSAAEVRHGPMALVGKGFPVFMFVPKDRTRDVFVPLAADFVARGAAVVAAGARLDGALCLPSVGADIADVDPRLAPLCFAQSFYRLVNALALARGCDPDRPPYLKKVTITA
ncbi:MAG: SIS domain-containing protein [Alphaproteobacteria bacterium]|nr:MAG: SIS domain-containing protein [Alphaproteobacteria bacterium]